MGGCQDVGAGQKSGQSLLNLEMSKVSPELPGPPAGGGFHKEKSMRMPMALLLVGLLGPLGVSQPAASAQATRPTAPATRRAETPKGRVDRYGDPLPPGAVARLGAARLLHPSAAKAVAFTADSRQLVTLAGESLWYWRVADGRLVRRVRIGNLRGQSTFLSTDGKIIAVGTLEVFEPGKHGRMSVALRDTAKDGRVGRFSVQAKNPLQRLQGLGRSRDPGEGAKIRRAWEEKRKKIVAGPLNLVFTPDGKKVVTSDMPARLWDVAKGTVIRTFAEKKERALAVGLSRDGKVLATSDKMGLIRLWDVRSGKLVKKFLVAAPGKAAPDKKPDKKKPAAPAPPRIIRLVFSADGEFLACRDTVGILRVWNIAGKKPALVLTIRGPVLAESFLWKGATLVVCQADAIRFWDVTKGRESTEQRVSVPQGCAPGRSVCVSRDGRHLAVTLAGGAQCPGLWDLAGRKRRFSQMPQHRYVAAGTALSGDGRFAFTLAGGLVRKWDGRTGRLIMKFRESKMTGWRDMIRLCPDGKTVVTLSASAGGGRCWDATTGKPRSGVMATRYRHGGMALAPDGRIAAIAESHMRDSRTSITIKLWKVPTGKLLRSFGMPGKNAFRPTFSPDGKLLVCRGDGTGCIAGAETGWKTRTISLGSVFCMMCVPDNRTVMVDDGSVNKPRVHFLNIQNGKRIRTEFTPSTIHGYRLSADGRFLATVGGLGDFKIRLLELISFQPVLKFMPGGGFAADVALSTDGRRAVTAGTDPLVWSLDPWDHTREARPTARDVRKLWADLASKDATKAYRAAWAMVHIGEPVLALLDKELRKAVAAQKPVAKMIPALDDKTWRVRRGASKEIAGLSGAAEPLLRRARDQARSQEVRHRLNAILEEGYTPILPAERRRPVRAVMVLERIGSQAARCVLARAAAGQEGYPLTASAKAALRRLAKGPAATAPASRRGPPVSKP